VNVDEPERLNASDAFEFPELVIVTEAAFEVVPLVIVPNAIDVWLSDSIGAGAAAPTPLRDTDTVPFEAFETKEIEPVNVASWFGAKVTFTVQEVVGRMGVPTTHAPAGLVNAKAAAGEPVGVIALKIKSA
jgi:hypothetical protein